VSLILACFSFYRNIHVLAAACFKNVLSVPVYPSITENVIDFMSFYLLLKLFCNIISIAVFIVVVVIDRDPDLYILCILVCVCHILFK
jgi:hypothetical protein